MSAAKKLSVMLNYMLDLSDYSGTSNVLSNACMANDFCKGRHVFYCAGLYIGLKTIVIVLNLFI